MARSGPRVTANQAMARQERRSAVMAVQAGSDLGSSETQSGGVVSHTSTPHTQQSDIYQIFCEFANATSV